MGVACNCDNDKKINVTINNKEPEKFLPFSYENDVHKTYQFLRVLNHGSFGQVSLYCDKTFKDKKYAVKTISKINSKKSKLNQILSEINILSKLDHPNIVKYFRTLEDSYNCYIIMEYLSGKDLDKIFKEDYNKLTLNDIKYILYQVFSALCYIHKNNIVHRDIKPANILCIKNNSKFDLKLIDFGLSANLDKLSLEKRAGSPAYVAPEAIKNCIDTKNDIWACGVILYNYIYGKMPFTAESKSGLFEKITTDDVEYDESLIRPHIPKEAIDLCKKLLEKDYVKRLTAWESLNHNFFKKFQIVPGIENEMVDEFFTKKTIENIRLYVNSNIIKKVFLCYYVLLSSFDEETNLRQIFLVLQKNMSNNGTLNSKDLYDEFKKKKLLESGDKKLFTLIDNIRLKNVKTFLQRNNPSSKDVQISMSNKCVSSTHSSKMLVDWGSVSYSVFLCFYFIDKIFDKEDNFYDAKAEYLFKLMSNDGEYEEEKTEDVENSKLNSYKLLYINKTTFKNYLFKHGSPFLEERSEINQFFKEHPNNIDYKEFRSLIE